MSSKLCFQRCFDACFRRSFELSHGRCDALSFGSSYVLGDDASFDRCSDLSFRLSSRMSFQRSFPTSFQGNFPRSFRFPIDDWRVQIGGCRLADQPQASSFKLRAAGPERRGYAVLFDASPRICYNCVEG